MAFPGWLFICICVEKVQIHSLYGIISSSKSILLNDHDSFLFHLKDSLGCTSVSSLFVKSSTATQFPLISQVNMSRSGGFSTSFILLLMITFAMMRTAYLSTYNINVLTSFLLCSVINNIKIIYTKLWVSACLTHIVCFSFMVTISTRHLNISSS